MVAPIDADLKTFGYAPGSYYAKCRYCLNVFADLDKRATSCRPCAVKAWNRRAPAPAAPQGVETAISEVVAAVEQYHRAFPNLDQPVPRQRVHDTVCNLRTAIAADVASEREACAQICDAEADEQSGRNADRHWQSRRLAAAIRARGGTNG